MLAERWPIARIIGLDSSAPMLAKASEEPSAIVWELGDIGRWQPPGEVDLIFSNAALHWLSDHHQLMPRLAASLAPGGVLACQMPIAFETRHHGVLRDVAANGPWAAHLSGLAPVAPTPTLDDYYGWLAGSCGSVDIWTTTYLHVLQGEDPVVDWMSGSALRPYLDALSDPKLRAAFLDALGDAMAQAFPVRPDGATLLPFPRLFILAIRA
jgi:trans-aconitate 2-methyltransferase